MKPTLAALSCLLALGSAFAKDPTPCSSPDQFGGRDKAWVAAFNDVDARFNAIPEKTKSELQASLTKAPSPNAGCVAFSGEEFDECGIFVDHLLLRGLFKIKGSSRWYGGDAESPNLESTKEAAPIFDRMCELREERDGARAAATQSAVEDKAAAIRKRELDAQVAATTRMVHTFGDGLPAPNDGADQSAQEPSAFQTAYDAVKQTVSALTPEIISNNVGQRCGLNADPGCGCRVWEELGCSQHPEAPACRSTVASMCPSLGQ